MKNSKFAVLACILVCAFLASGFVNFASAATPKVTVTPSDPAVKLGGTQQFQATVSGVKNPTVTWSLDSTSLANGCTISSSGKLTVPNTITPDSFKPVVTATYTGTSSVVSGTATFTVTDPSPAPGLFMGSINYADGTEALDLAMNVKKGGAIDALALNGTLTGYATFPAMFILSKNTVHGTYKNSTGTFTLLGEVEYDGGTADVMTGSVYTAGQINPIGTWTATRTTTGLAKVGSFTITDKSLFGAVISGTMAGVVMPPSTSAFFGVGEVTSPAKYKRTDVVNGTFEQTSPGVITYSFTILGYSVSGTAPISADGTISKNMVYNGVKVGTWTLHDL